ncbi:MAG: ribose 5-phosphate isomerase B [Erysipelotrichaceae bacterium]|nr:ribose 5-phosphate isomerase B [Erysipelotrichaceae bacterium]
MKIVIGNDHSAVEMKQEILKYIETLGHEVINVGTDVIESVDYPDYGYKVAKTVVNHDADLGIAICGTGIGISLAANKVRGIRAFACSEPYSAKLARNHNDANVLCFGARVVGVELAKMMVKTFLEAEFEGERHARRVGKIMKIEAEEFDSHE